MGKRRPRLRPSRMWVAAADLARLDRTRKTKGFNDDWTHPHGPDAKITKMKDTRTCLAHKAEHALDGAFTAGC